jgi:hypothetical protein
MHQNNNFVTNEMFLANQQPTQGKRVGQIKPGSAP